MDKHYPKESHLRSLLKGISWRLIAMLDTFLIALIVTWIVYGVPEMEKSLWIMIIETPLKFIAYYLHERLWQYFWKNKNIQNKDILHKTISWRIVATSMTFLISGKVLGKGAEGVALIIAITELISKTILYYFHEKFWLRITRGSVRNLFKKIKSRFI